MTKLFGFCVVFVVSVTARAGLMLEPYVGYEFTKNSSTVTGSFLGQSSNVDIPGGVSGGSYGLRLGYKLPALLWAALDYSGGTASMKFDNAGNLPGGNENITRSVLGVTAGIDIPFLIRAWVGYGFSDQMTTSGLLNSSQKDTLKGTNTKVGIALNTLPLISINLEYIMHKFTSGSGDDFSSGGFSTVYVKAEQTELMASISLPLNL